MVRPLGRRDGSHADPAGVFPLCRLAATGCERSALCGQGEALLATRVVSGRPFLGIGRRAPGLLLDLRLADATGAAGRGHLDRPVSDLGPAGLVLAAAQLGGDPQTFCFPADGLRIPAVQRPFSHGRGVGGGWRRGQGDGLRADLFCPQLAAPSAVEYRLDPAGTCHRLSSLGRRLVAGGDRVRLADVRPPETVVNRHVAGDGRGRDPGPAGVDSRVAAEPRRRHLHGPRSQCDLRLPAVASPLGFPPVPALVYHAACAPAGLVADRLPGHALLAGMRRPGPAAAARFRLWSAAADSHRNPHRPVAVAPLGRGGDAVEILLVSPRRCGVAGGSGVGRRRLGGGPGSPPSRVGPSGVDRCRTGRSLEPGLGQLRAPPGLSATGGRPGSAVMEKGSGPNSPRV